MSKKSLSLSDVLLLTAAICILSTLPALAASQARIVRLSDVQGSVQIDKNTGIRFRERLCKPPDYAGHAAQDGREWPGAD